MILLILRGFTDYAMVWPNFLLSSTHYSIIFSYQKIVFIGYYLTQQRDVFLFN